MKRASECMGCGTSAGCAPNPFNRILCPACMSDERTQGMVDEDPFSGTRRRGSELESEAAGEHLRPLSSTTRSIPPANAPPDARATVRPGPPLLNRRFRA